jgi:hypothetical protein
MNSLLRFEEEVIEVLMERLRLQGHMTQEDIQVIEREKILDLGKEC